MTTTIDIIRLFIDFGFLILIWMIQRIVYPSFLYFEPQNLINWHRNYTTRFSYIVVPLLIAQLSIAAYKAFLLIHFYTITPLVIIGILWYSTFSQFVPIHSKISKGDGNKNMLNELVRKNWLRTILWTILFIMDCCLFFYA